MKQRFGYEYEYDSLMKLTYRIVVQHANPNSQTLFVEMGRVSKKVLLEWGRSGVRTPLIPLA